MSTLGLFMSYPCDLFFIFSLHFIITNHYNLIKTDALAFANFLEYLLLVLDNNIDEENE